MESKKQNRWTNKTNRLIDTKCKLMVARGAQGGGIGQNGEGC